MAAVHGVVLSSPPRPISIVPTTPFITHHAVSSSPSLPSVSEILAERMPGPLNKSKAKADHSDTTLDFTSARNLPRENNPKSSDATNAPGDVEQDLPKGEGSGSMNKGKSRPTPKMTEGTNGAESVVNDENIDGFERKKPGKKSKKTDQTKIAKTKITKPRSSSQKLKVYKESTGAAAGADTKSNTSIANHGPDLGLIEALQRKRDWTPARDSSKAVTRVETSEVARSAIIPVGSPCSNKLADGDLSKRLGVYSFGGPDQVVSRHYPLRDSDGQATKKRKLELVTSLASAVTKPTVSKRSKSPRKKPQTITDKATAPFILNDQTGPSTILNYFPNPQLSTNFDTLPLDQHDVATSETSKKVKVRSSKPKAKKVKDIPILHQPEFAMRVANEQDLLFGTCSQLARDESPSFIRDLQQAVKESEAVDDSQRLSQPQESQISTISSSSNSSRLPTATRGLWSIAARNDPGDLLDVEIVDLVDTPQGPRLFPARSDPTGIQKEKSVPPTTAFTTAVDNDWRTIDSPTTDQGATSLHLDQQAVDFSLPRSVAEASLRTRPESKSPVKRSSHRADDSLAIMPNYQGFTDVDLKKAVSETGFKVMRKRETRIAHLEDCWHAAQSRRATLDIPAPSIATNVGADESTKPNSAAKKRGRPPKKPSVSTDENRCVDTHEVSPKKARGRPRKGGASVESTTTKTHNESRLDTNSLEKASEAHKIPATSTKKQSTQDIAPLLATITDAITKHPPTHDAQNLTPYERILLYDPIVLEDLSQWLNEEGLKRVGCEETVDPRIAKLWCESQSVCCLWRENLRGGTRARY